MTGPQRSVDLVVVGGGVIGAWTAYEAVRRNPGWRVTVLERSAVGRGASAWSAGVSFPLAATAGHVALVRASRAAYARLDGTPAAAHLRTVPMVYVTTDPGALADRVVDAELRPLTAAEEASMRAMLPDAHLGSGDIALTHDGHGFAVDAASLAATLLAMCGPAATVLPNTPVAAVDAGDAGFTVRCDVHGGRTIAARRVVLACGPWALPAVHPHGFAEPDGARRKRIAALHADLDAGTGAALVSFVDDDVFVLPTTPGKALVSFYREEWDTDPDRLDGRPVAADLEAGVAALARRSPALAAAVTGGRAFCDLYTPHRLPRVLTDLDLPGMVAIRGGSGSGVRLAPAMAIEALERLS